MWSEELITSTLTAAVVAGDRQVLEDLDQHLGVHRVAGVGPLQPQHGDALLVHLVAGAQLAAQPFSLMLGT